MEDALVPQEFLALLLLLLRQSAPQFGAEMRRNRRQRHDTRRQAAFVLDGISLDLINTSAY